MDFIFSNFNYSDIETPTLSIYPRSPVEGLFVTMKCSTNANPAVAEYAFYKGEEQIAYGTEHTFTFNATKEHSGDYNCSATNSVGTKESILHNLDVQCKDIII